MIEIARYRPEDQPRWDQFVRSAKNGHFMFERGFMDYHADRFDDHSLLFLKRDHLVALLPGHLRREDDESGAVTFASHDGLPFAGVLSGIGMRAGLMLELFEMLTDYLRQQGARELRYKAIPSPYHRYPAEEDTFALLRAGASIAGTKLACARPLGVAEIHEHKTRRRHAKTAAAHHIEVRPGLDPGTFHDFLSRWLADRHHAAPVHTRNELETLAGRFPDGIQTFGAWRDGELLAANMIFLSNTCYRLQYAANSSRGLELRAGDAIWDFLINHHFQAGQWLDLGTSMLPDSRDFDPGLVEFKESMGGRAIVQHTFRLALS